MKKILLISLEFPPFQGGVANYYYNLCKNIPTDKIVVLTEKQPTGHNSFKIISRALISKFPIWPRWVSGLIKTFFYARSEKVEVLWAGQILPIGTICLFLKKVLKLPYFISCHGTDLLTAISNSRKKNLIKKILNNASLVTANSNYTKKILQGLGVANEKIIIIYPCPNDLIDVEPQKLKLLEEKFNKKNNKIILSVGRLVPRKNFTKLICLIPEVLKTHPHIIYLIVGNGPEEKNLQKIIDKNNLHNSIKILTNINNSDLPYYYSLCDIFVLIPVELANEIEGFGMVYLEAGLHQKPVIASKSGGVADAVIDQKSGLIIDADSDKEIKEAIIKLLDQPNLRKNFGHFAKINILKQFQWSEQTKILIKSLIEKI